MAVAAARRVCAVQVARGTQRSVVGSAGPSTVAHFCWPVIDASRPAGPEYLIGEPQTHRQQQQSLPGKARRGYCTFLSYTHTRTQTRAHARLYTVPRRRLHEKTGSCCRRRQQRAQLLASRKFSPRLYSVSVSRRPAMPLPLVLLLRPNRRFVERTCTQTNIGPHYTWTCCSGVYYSCYFHSEAPLRPPSLIQTVWPTAFRSRAGGAATAFVGNLRLLKQTRSDSGVLCSA